MIISPIAKDMYVYTAKSLASKQVAFKSDNQSSVNDLLNQREITVAVLNNAQAELDRANNYNVQNAFNKMMEAIQLEKSDKGVDKFYKDILGNETREIEKKHHDNFKYEKEDVRYIKKNKDFFANVVKQSQQFLKYIDKQIEQLTGSSVDVLLKVLGKEQENKVHDTNRPTYVNPDTPHTPAVADNTSGGKKPPADLSDITKPSNINSVKKLLTEDDFHRIKKEDIPQMVKDISKGTEEEKQALLELYTKLDIQHQKLPNNDPIRKPMADKLNVLEKTMIDSNISFVPKAPEVFNSEAEKIEYLQITHVYSILNEASAMDSLKAFEKYGGRYEYGIENCANGILDLTVNVSRIADRLSPETTDKVFSKYIDLFNKYADITPPKNNDTRYLGSLIEHYHDKMSEDTIYKFIDSIKKFAFERSQTWSVRKYILENEFTKRSPEELARINEKVCDLEKSVEKLPFKDWERLNG